MRMRYNSVLNTGNYFLQGNQRSPLIVVVREKRLILAHMLFCPFSAPLIVVRLQWQRPSKYWESSSLSSEQICLTHISECSYSFYKQRIWQRQSSYMFILKLLLVSLHHFCCFAAPHWYTMTFLSLCTSFFQWGWLVFLSFFIPAALHFRCSGSQCLDAPALVSCRFVPAVPAVILTHHRFLPL